MQSGLGFLADIESGGYINPWKTLVLVLIVLGWARILTWADKDATIARLPRDWMNLGLLGGLILAVVCFLFLPSFTIGLLVMVFLFLAEVGTYLGLRHSSVGLGDLKDSIIALSKGIKKDQSSMPGVADVLLFTTGTNALRPPDLRDDRRIGYDGIQKVLKEPLRKGAERIELIPAGETAEIRYSVDGMWYDSASIDTGTQSVSYIKAITGLSEQERRKPQTAKMKVTCDGQRHELEITTMGNAAGESLKIQVDPKNRHSIKLADIGLLPDQLEKIKASIAERRGIVLVAAPKGQGLTTMLYSLLRGHDAFLTHIHTIERNAEENLEGITQNALSSTASPAEELKLVSWVTSQEPDVLMVDQIEDPRTAVLLAKFAGDGQGHKVYVGLRAANTFEALGLWRRLVGDDHLAMMDLQMAVAGRVMRRLCAACKVAFTPDPEALRKLNMNPGKAPAWFQARREALRDAKGRPIPCEFCHDLRYKGRFGVYEVLSVNAEMKQAMESGASLNQLKAIFRKQRARFLQEMALGQVETGETSVQEVLRVMQVVAEPATAPGSRGSGSTAAV